MDFTQKIKQKIWRFLYPIWPQIEHKFVFLHGRRRQKFHVGWLAPHHTLNGLKKHLSSKWGFGNHFVAWEDDSQVLSWRKLTSFNEQYHLRIYSDGEIRGHYERTPESAPLRHFVSVGSQSKNKDFRNFLGSYMTIHRHISKLHSKGAITQDEPEVTFQK